MKKIKLLLAECMILFMTVLLAYPALDVKAADIGEGIVLYCDFDGSVKDISGTGSSISVISGDVGNPSFGTDGSGSDATYMKWTGASTSGGTRIQAEIPEDISDEYTIAMRFSLGSVSSWKKVVDYANFADDSGFYVYGGKLTFYGGDHPYGTTIYNNDEIIDLIATRKSDGTFTVYANKFDPQTGAKTTTVEIDTTSCANDSKPYTYVDQETGKTMTVIGFLGDDLYTSREYSANGCVYSVKVWNRALNMEEAALAADPLTLTYMEQDGKVLSADSFGPNEQLTVKSFPAGVNSEYVAWKIYYKGWRSNQQNFYYYGNKVTLDIATTFTAYTQNMIEVQPTKNTLEDSAYALIAQGEENNEAILNEIYKGAEAIEKIKYDLSLSKDENAALIEEQGKEILKNTEIKVNTIRFDDYKPTQTQAADALKISGDSAACQQLIANAKATINAMQFDSNSSLNENKAKVEEVITALNAALNNQRNKETFDTYKSGKLTEADGLAEADDSDRIIELINEAKNGINALQYDTTITLSENKAKLDNIVTTLKASLEEQRNKETFEIYKSGKLTEADGLAETDDSDKIIEIIAAAEEEINALQYDTTITLSENKAKADTIITTLKASLEEQRNKEAFEVYKNDVTAETEKLVKPGDSDDVLEIIAGAKAEINALQYDNTITLSENKAKADAIIEKLAASLDEQRIKEVFKLYKNEKASEADGLAGPDDSDDVLEIIAGAKAEIIALQYDTTITLAENKAKADAVITTLNATLNNRRNIEAFESYKNEKTSEADGLAKPDDGNNVLEIIAGAKAEIIALQYDTTITLAENKAKADAVIEALKEKLNHRNNGEIIVDTKKTENNYGKAEIAEVAELKQNLSVTPEEKEELNNGNDINVWINVEEQSETTEEEKEVIAESIPEDCSQLSVLDITLWKQVEGLEPNKITEVGNGEITISVTIPAEFVADNREYKVLRVHDGAVDVLDAVFDSTTNKIFFKTGKFSTYVIIFRDVEGNPIPVEKLPYYIPLINDMNATKSGTVIWGAGDGLPYEAVKLLVEYPTLSLEFTFTYEGEEHTVFIPAGTFGQYLDANIPWYGPAWLLSHFGSEGSAFEYTVQPDDTLNFIAFSHNTTVEEILRLNPQIGNRDLIWPGQKIKLK